MYLLVAAWVRRRATYSSSQGVMAAGEVGRGEAEGTRAAGKDKDNAAISIA
jgi:hypothetical protein